MDSENSLEQVEARIHDVSLDFETEGMRRAGYLVVDWIVARLGRLRDPETGVGQELSRDETEKLLREPLPEQPSSFEAVFDQYARRVAPNAISLDHPASSPSFPARRAM